MNYFKDLDKLKILLNVVLEKYPDLEDYNFSIKYNYLSDAYAMYYIDGKQIDIEINYSLKDKDDRLKIAAIASEISHIIKEKKLSFIPLGLGNLIEGVAYDVSKIYRKYDERQTDIETVKRGFGKELLEFLKYMDENDEESEGLTIIDLESLLSN